MTLKKSILIDEKAFILGFYKEAQAAYPHLDKKGFAWLAPVARGALAVAKAIPSSLGRVALKTPGLKQGLSAAKAFPSKLPSASQAIRGAGNAPARVAGWVGRTAKAQVGTVHQGRRVGGALTNPADIAKYVRESGGKAKLVKDRLGNINDMAQAQKIQGVAPFIRNLGRKEAWKGAAKSAFKPADTFLGKDVRKYKGKVGKGLRGAWNLAGSEFSGLHGAYTGLELLAADSPEARKEVFTQEVPAGLATEFMGRIGGKGTRASLLPMIGTYLGAKYLASKVPGSSAQRWGGYTQSQVDQLSKQYGYSDLQLKEYLSKQER